MSQRTDVAAVGTLAINSDVFLIAGLTATSPYYQLLVYNTAISQYQYFEGGLGTLLSGQVIPQGYELHYFKYDQSNLDDYPDYMYHVKFYPVTIDGKPYPGRQDTEVKTIIDNKKITRLVLGFRDQTYPGIRYDSNDPIMYPGAGNIQVGYRYNFYDTTSSNAITITAYDAQGKLAIGTQYGGLPFGLGSVTLPQPVMANIFLPLEWFAGSTCTSVNNIPTSVTPLSYHQCDRYGAMVNTTSDFYVKNCLTIPRGNVEESTCLNTNGYMYYASDGSPIDTSTMTGNRDAVTCGGAWGSQTNFTDMTNKTITGVTNSYGNCDDTLSVCSYDASGNAVCAPVVPDMTVCVGAEDICMDGCPTCNPTICVNGKGCINDCSKCRINCDKCPLTRYIPDWLWIIIAILGVIAIIMLLALLHRSTRNPKSPNEYNYDDLANRRPPGYPYYPPITT